MNQAQPVATAEISPDTLLGKSVLALNNAHAQELSWLEPEHLAQLVAQAFVARRIGNLDAFILALDQDARYDSPNFLWFRARYPRFVYVDRVVVASSARGCGYARGLYMSASSAKSTPAHRTRNRTPSMPHWDLSKSAAPASTMTARRCGICRVHLAR